MSNPYAWNKVNAQMCYGRDELINKLVKGLSGVESPRTSYGVAGGSRMGKTTLLRRVEVELKVRELEWRKSGLFVIPIYIDRLNWTHSPTPVDVWLHIVRELQAAIPNHTFRVSGELDFAAFKTSIEPVLVNMLERPRIIVMFDDIKPFINHEWSASFLSNWAALLSNTPPLDEYFTAIFTGARELTILRHDVTSPLATILSWENLQALDRGASTLLMQHPIGRVWPDTFIDKAYKETGGHPMLLQYIMQTVHAASPGNAEQTLAHAVVSFERECYGLFDMWWTDYCTQTAQQIYICMPDNGNTIPKRTVTKDFGLTAANNALDILQHMGLIATENQGYAYRYSGEMFRRWYRTAYNDF